MQLHSHLSPEDEIRTDSHRIALIRCSYTLILARKIRSEQILSQLFDQMQLHSHLSHEDQIRTESHLSALIRCSYTPILARKMRLEQILISAL